MVTGWHLRFASCNFIFPEFSCYASAMIRNNFPSARLIFNSWLALCFSSLHYKYCNSTKHRCSSRNWKLTLLQRPVQSMRRCLDLRNISGKPSDHITCSITLQLSQTWGFNRFSFWYRFACWKQLIKFCTGPENTLKAQSSKNWYSAEYQYLQDTPRTYVKTSKPLNFPMLLKPCQMWLYLL